MQKRVRDGVLTLSKMYFADEVRSHDELESGHARVSKRELELPRSVVDGDPGETGGQDVHAEPRTEEAAPLDLLEALRDSVTRYSRPQSRHGSRRGDGLGDLTKSDLEQREKRKSIKGYSRMTKDELVAVLR